MTNIPDNTPDASKPAYTAPQVTELGTWKNMTLIYSLPIGPGTRGVVGGYVSGLGEGNKDA